MNLLQCIIRLRPGATWKKGMVNGFSLETIAKTYQSSQGLPTLPECEAMQLIIDREDKEKEISTVLKNKLISICGDLYEKGVPQVLQGIRRRIEKGGFSNAHKGYIRYNKTKYTMDEDQAVEFIDALEECAINMSDFKNERADELEGLTTEQLENYDVGLPNGETWPSMPDPNDYTGA